MSSKQATVDKQLDAQIQEFYKSVSSNAEDVIFRAFPSKILELQKLIDATASLSSPYSLSHASTLTDATVYPAPSTASADEPDAKKRKRTTSDGKEAIAIANGSSLNDTSNARFPNLILSNKHTSQVHEEIKKLAMELAEHCDKVKLWVNLNMPKIEDGDNFGVQIQEEVLQELHRSQESAYNLRDSARTDHLARAKICSKIIKYPHVEDYALSLKEHDEKQLYTARQHLLDIRNVYAVLTDIIHKNITKLRSPKANNSLGLY